METPLSGPAASPCLPPRRVNVLQQTEAGKILDRTLNAVFTGALQENHYMTLWSVHAIRSLICFWETYDLHTTYKCKNTSPFKCTGPKSENNIYKVILSDLDCAINQLCILF